MPTTAEAGAERRSNQRSASTVTHEHRVDPAGTVHTFARGAMWSRCRQHVLSLTTAVPDPRGPRCAACSLDEEKPMPTILACPARRWLARRVLGLVRRVPKLHVWLARVAPPKTLERARSTRALVATVAAWRTVEQRAEDTHAIAGTDDLPRVLRLTAGMIDSERRARDRRAYESRS